MQKVTKDNFTEVFNGLAADLDAVGQTNIDSVKDAVSKLRAVLDEKRKGAEENVEGNNVLKIGVVGQVKAGKSSFLNSLFFNGENVLPRASTPMTAGLTVLEYGDENSFDVEYYNEAEWNTFCAKNREYEEALANFKNEMRQQNPSITDDVAEQNALNSIDDVLKSAHELVEGCGAAAKGKIRPKSLIESQPFAGVEGLQDTLEKYVGAHGAFTSVVKSLTIKMNHEGLRNLRIVDTPGVNDPVVSRERRTREFLRSCHGVFFLSYSGHFFDATDQVFLSDRIGGEGIGAVVMIASKFDAVLQQVGLDFKDDIQGAMAHCERMLRKQFTTNMGATSFSGPTPALTFSSGIGFSIAQKPQERWDAVEANVVSQMKRFFPSFFSTPDDVKMAFNELAQIDSIREKYVIGTFASKKDEILAQKLNDFFATSTTQIAKEADKGIKNVEEFLTSLRSDDIESLNKQKEDVAKVKKAIESKINKLDRLDVKLDTAIKSVMVGCPLSSPRLSTRDRNCVKFTRLSTFWERNKDFYVSYQLPDVQKAIKSVDTQLDAFEKNVKDQWKKQVEELKKFIVDSLKESVHSAEDAERSVDGASLMNVIDDVADRFDNAAVIDLSDVIQLVKDNCENDLQEYGDDVRYYKCSQSEEEAQADVKSAARELCDGARQALADNFNPSDIRKDVTDVLEGAAEIFKDVITKNKHQFIDEIGSKMQARIAELEQSLNDKENKLKQAETALNALKSFRSKL